MAKKSKIAREKHLAKKVKRHYLLRKELRDLIKHPNTSEEDKLKIATIATITTIARIPYECSFSILITFFYYDFLKLFKDF